MTHDPTPNIEYLWRPLPHEPRTTTGLIMSLVDILCRPIFVRLHRNKMRLHRTNIKLKLHEMIITDKCASIGSRRKNELYSPTDLNILVLTLTMSSKKGVTFRKPLQWLPWQRNKVAYTNMPILPNAPTVNPLTSHHRVSAGVKSDSTDPWGQETEGICQNPHSFVQFMVSSFFWMLLAVLEMVGVLSSQT